jgi:hypothetical protein
MPPGPAAVPQATPALHLHVQSDEQRLAPALAPVQLGADVLLLHFHAMHFMQIPDLDAVFMTADFPCIKKKWPHGGGGPTPMFGYQGSVRHYDLPFPDYAFWGHEYQYLQVLLL